MTNQWTTILVIIAVALFMVAAFWTGYNTADNRNRKALNETRKNLRTIYDQQTKLTRWVRQNWPNEFEAYRRGHLEGYQQGVRQAADIEEELRT